MQFTLSQAAKEVGLSKGTLSRALSSGKLSAERREDGSYQIEASELFRVFPMRTPKTQARTDPQPPGTPLNPSMDETAAAVETAILRTKLEAAEAKIADMARAHEEARETVQDLRRRLDRAEDRVLALSALPIQPILQPTQERPTEPPAASRPPKASKGFLARLLGWES